MFNPSFIFTIITAIAPVEVKGFEVLVRRKKKNLPLLLQEISKNYVVQLWSEKDLYKQTVELSFLVTPDQAYSAYLSFLFSASWAQFAL